MKLREFLKLADEHTLYQIEAYKKDVVLTQPTTDYDRIENQKASYDGFVLKDEITWFYDHEVVNFIVTNKGLLRIQII